MYQQVLLYKKSQTSNFDQKFDWLQLKVCLCSRFFAKKKSVFTH